MMPRSGYSYRLGYDALKLITQNGAMFLPHAVIEYARSLERDMWNSGIMEAVHSSLLACGQFGEQDIKVRAYPCDHALVAGKPSSFIHVTIYLLSGRSDTIKKDITSRVLAALQALEVDVASLSVDARDLNRAVYSKDMQE